MFTGLIAETGTVVSLEKKVGVTRIHVAAPTLAKQLGTGDSIAVSGVCLTALNITPESFEADLLEETIRRTSLTHLAPGSRVNLELPTPAGTPLGGHVVQGHVDGVGYLLSLTAVTSDADYTDWTLKIAAPAALSPYIVEKGSIAINGISLTVAKVEPAADRAKEVTVALIPHTYAVTNIHTLQAGDPVNLEVDVLAKYAEERAKKTADESITELSLIAAGF
jgi:riboflavin synthase